MKLGRYVLLKKLIVKEGEEQKSSEPEQIKVRAELTEDDTDINWINLPETVAKKMNLRFDKH